MNSTRSTKYLNLQPSRSTYDKRPALSTMASLAPSPTLIGSLLLPKLCYSPISHISPLGFKSLVTPRLHALRCADLQYFPPAHASQTSSAIVFVVLRRICGAVFLRGPRPSSRLGALFWPSGLTVRRSRPPTASAELRATRASLALSSKAQETAVFAQSLSASAPALNTNSRVAKRWSQQASPIAGKAIGSRLA